VRSEDRRHRGQRLGLASPQLASRWPSGARGTLGRRSRRPNGRSPSADLPRVHCRYFELYRMRTDRHWLHQKIVSFAREHGIKATVREFGCSRNTVRKWLRRAIPGKPSSLAEQSRAPKRCPHKTPSGLEGQIVKLRKQTGFGAERLVREFDLKVSHNAVARIIRQHGLSRPRKKKPAPKSNYARLNGSGNSLASSRPTPNSCRTSRFIGLR